MTRLVEDLLELARLEAGRAREHQEIEVTTLLEEAVVRVRALGNRTIELACEGSSGCKAT